MTDPSAAPAPETPPTFDVLPLSADLRKGVDACGYAHPTPVQRAVFEPASRGRSLVVQARTGTGKTAAFGLPILDTLVKRSVPHVQALVLTPTRELALQVANELERLGQFRGVKIAAVYGGAPMGAQIEALQGGAQIVSGTPGRVLDHLRRGTFDPSHVRIFVLDEADEMLSMGFARELHAIVEKLPKERQGLFFSATIPPDIERLAHAQLKDPEFVTLSSDQVGALSVQHFVYMLRGGDKRQELVRIIEVEDPEGAIIFCNTKDETERMAEALQNKGYDADWLNGDLEQKERERKMAATREGKLRFLVATDVAARGIDISHLTHVINADFPESAEQYVHRTGRTGRAGRTGTAISIVGPKDIGNLYILRLTYKIRPIEREVPTAGELKTRAEHDVVALFAEAFGSRPADPDDLALARRLLTHVDAEKMIAGLIRDHLGARPVAAGVGGKPTDARAEAAEARRARNPAPLPAPAPPPAASPAKPPASNGAAALAPSRPERPERAERAESRDDRGPRTETAGSREPPPARPREGRREAPRDQGGGARVPHKAYATWEPPAEQDDDAPILAGGPPATGGKAPFRPEPPPLPGITESAAQGATPARSGGGFEGAARPRVRQDDAEADTARTAEGRDRDAEDEALYTQIFVNVGRRDGLRPGDLQRLLDASLGPADTGRIRIRDRNTFVSVRHETVERAIKALAGQSVAGRSVIAEVAKPRPERTERPER